MCGIVLGLHFLQCFFALKRYESDRTFSGFLRVNSISYISKIQTTFPTCRRFSKSAHFSWCNTICAMFSVELITWLIIRNGITWHVLPQFTSLFFIAPTVQAAKQYQMDFEAQRNNKLADFHDIRGVHSRG